MASVSKRNWIIAGTVVAIPVLAVGWWLGSPLFLDTEVNEAFPRSSEAVVPDDMTQEQVEDEMESAASQAGLTVEDDMPDSASPAQVSTGEFADYDNFHKGSGTATIYTLEDGSQVLRLEGFEVTNGPDLHVLLVPNANPEDRDDITGYLDLGSLKGNIGDQNYGIPDGMDVTEYGSVVIYCQPFHVIFSVASLG